MNFRGLDMNLLVVLNMLLEEKSVTRTSRRIYLSQPATSEALARLREFFHDEILIQTGNRMILTPLAESLVQPVQELLKFTQTIIDCKQDFSPASSQRNFRVMVSEYVSIILMPRIFKRLETEAPKVEIEIFSVTENADEQLDRAEIDLLIRPEQFLSSNHPSQKLFRETHTCLVWSENPEIGDSISPDEYFSATHIEALYRNRRSNHLDWWLFTHMNRKRKFVAHISRDHAAIPYMILGTKHIATVHKHLAETLVNFLPVRIASPQFEMPFFFEAMQWHSIRDGDPGVVWLRDLIQDVVREKLGDNHLSDSVTGDSLFPVVPARVLRG